MNNSYSRLFIGLVALLTCSGCSSFVMHTGGCEGIYIGARTDATYIAHPSTFPFLPPPITVALAIIDIAPSAALDTLFLPIDLTYEGY
jgi:uncharacterized protein YceK